MSSSLDHKCQRCGSQYHGQICPFCTITGLDVNALLAAEGLTMPQTQSSAATATATEPVDEASQVTLVDVVSNRTFPVTTPICRFGRDISNDIVLTGDKSLSRFHFQITLLNGDYFVEDSGSRNGSFLNGSPVTAPRKVLNGDIISAGMTRYRFVLGSDLSGGGEFSASEFAPEAGANGATEAGASSAQGAESAEPAVDPLMKIFEEGQALLSSGQSEQEDMTDIDAFFSSKELGNGDDKSDSGFMKLDRPKETPVDELFQEQLRAINAANDTTKSDSGEFNLNGADHSAESNGNNPPPLKSEEPVAAADSPSAEFSAPALAEEPASEPPPLSDRLGANTIPDVPELAPATPVAETAPEAPNSIAEPAFAPPQAPSHSAAPAPADEDQSWPDWCRAYHLPELANVHARMAVLESEIAERHAELANLGALVASVESMKNRLLAGSAGSLQSAICEVFEKLGWDHVPNGDTTNEIVLRSDGKAAALVRIVSTESQPKPNELASLVSSLSNYWSETGVEPKGILLVSFSSNAVPSERPSFTDDYAAYASKKNLCVMSSTQLLAIFRQLTFRKANVESIQASILDTSGKLPGFDPDADEPND